MKINASFAIATLFAVAVVGWMASGMIQGDSTPPATAATDTAAAPASTPQPDKPVAVRVRRSQAEMREIRVRLFGQTEANRTVEVRAETAGRIDALDVAEGDAVADKAVIAEIDMDDRLARRDRARAEVAFRQIAYDAAKKLEARQFQTRINLAEAESQLAQAKAALREIELEIADTRVLAPFAGVVNDLAVELGDYVKDGDIVATVVDFDPVIVSVEVTETWVSGVQKGDVARIELATGRSLSGKVRFISRVASPTTRTFRVEIEVPNPDSSLAEGVTAEVDIPVGRVSAHRISPALLTLDDDGRLGLKAVAEGGRVIFHPIDIVEDSTAGMWVSGLPERATLITVGQEFVAVGGRVEAVDETTLSSEG
jgi:multidrug efflux system membrane fusion protein